MTIMETVGPAYDKGFEDGFADGLGEGVAVVAAVRALLLFISPKLKFLSPHGLEPAGSPAQGTTLMARGADATQALYRAERAGLGKVWRR